MNLSSDANCAGKDDDLIIWEVELLCVWSVNVIRILFSSFISQVMVCHCEKIVSLRVLKENCPHRESNKLWDVLLECFYKLSEGSYLNHINSKFDNLSYFLLLLSLNNLHIVVVGVQLYEDSH